MSYSEGEAIQAARDLQCGPSYSVKAGDLGKVMYRSKLSENDKGYMVDWGSDGKWRVNPDEIEPAMVSAVTKPVHYDLPGGIQVIDLIRDESFLRGNLIKYVFRAPHKGNELQDMKKAAEYLKWEIERLENEQSS